MDTDFYKKRYQRGDRYGRAEYNVDNFFRLRPVQKWLSGKKTLRALDVGCGSGIFARQVYEYLGGAERVEQFAGVDLVNVLVESSVPDFHFEQADLNAEKLPFAESTFDLIFCNHLIEHLFETEHLMDELYRVVSPGGLVVVSTPNLAWWANPFFLFLGLQPIGTEVGTKTIAYGLSFLGNRLKDYGTAGHIRAFTPRALRDMAKASGFNLFGWWSQNRIKALQLLPWRERNMGLVLQKGQNAA